VKEHLAEVTVGMHLAGNLVEFGMGKPRRQGGAMEFWLGFRPPCAWGHIRSVVWDNDGVRWLVLGALSRHVLPCWETGPSYDPWSCPPR